MGVRISIDKYVSTLEEFLDFPPSYFKNLKYEIKVDSSI